MLKIKRVSATNRQGVYMVKTDSDELRSTDAALQEAFAIKNAINNYAEIYAALVYLVDHAQEKYPHFESERGQENINRALAALAKNK